MQIRASAFKGEWVLVTDLLADLGSLLSISGAASVPAKLRPPILGSTLTINNTANAGNFTTVGNVFAETLTAWAQQPRQASQPPERLRADHHRAASAGPLSVDGQRGLRG